MLKLTVAAVSLALLLSAFAFAAQAPCIFGLPGYVDYAIKIAQRVRNHMYDATYGGYYFEVSRDWTSVSDYSKSFLGNCFIIRGFLQLYKKTGDSKYLSWAKEGIETLWTECWDQTNGGFFNEYNQDWTRNTELQSLQEQAEFVHIALDAYDDLTGNSDYRQWADTVMHFIMDNYHDDTNGGMYKTRNGVTGVISDDRKHMEISLGAFAWDAMKWYSYTNDATAKAYSEECINWMRNYLWNSATSGYMSETSETGSVTNAYYYPNIETWGLVGMMEYYKQTSDATVKSWIMDGLNHIHNYMWDSTYGGWYRKLNPDNSVKEDTKTGWDNSEQPWFWYYAYEVLGEALCWNVAVMSLDWTRDHLWDSTYEGIFLEMNREGTTPEWEVKNDWVQGGAMVAFAYVTEVRPPAVPEFSFSPIIIASLTATLYLTLKKYRAKGKFIFMCH